MTSAKRWNKEDEEFLIANYQKLSNKELADRFGVTTISVQRKLSRLGLIRQVQKKWEEDEEGYLRENYLNLSDKELADRYGVTEISIKRKLNRLGLKRSAPKKPARKAGVAPLSREKGKTPPRSSDKPAQREAPVVMATRGNEREYNTTETYEINEIIFHPVFQDKGKVMEKLTTADGNRAIIVNFHRVGRKVLMEGLG